MAHFTPRNYQADAIKALVLNPIFALLADPGLGKTATSLFAFQALKRLGVVRRALVVAPLRVVHCVWPQEVQDWAQLQGLTVSIVHGSPQQRIAAIGKDADLYLINAEGIPWLTKQAHLPDWQCLIVDESTKFKTPGSVRSKALRKFCSAFLYRWIMTGSVLPNNIEQIWSQYSLLDDRLGKNITAFRSRYMHRGGFEGREWIANPHSIEQILPIIAPITMRLSRDEHLDLPPLHEIDIKIDLPPKVKAAYQRLIDQGQLDHEETDITVLSGSSTYNLCRQVASGGAYQHDFDEHCLPVTTKQVLHSAKLEALADLIDTLNGRPLMVAYWYKHTLDRLQKHFGQVPVINGDTSGKDSVGIVADWNSGSVPLLFCQPASMGHGLNMQKAGCRDVAWFDLTDDREVYDQFNARVYRSGMGNGSATIHRLLARGTIDTKIAHSLVGLGQQQNRFYEGLNEQR